MGIFSKIKSSKNKMLVLAEKPNVAADYAKAVKAERRSGYYENNKYVITYALGHLCTLFEPEDYNSEYKKWKLEMLPIIPDSFYIKLRNSNRLREQFKVIKELIERQDIDIVCIGTDSAREGELIGRYILAAANNKKPIYRLWINNSLTQSDVITGFKNIKSAVQYDNLYKSAQARDQIDWLIGFNFSRAYSLKEKKQYTIGRCLIAVLSLICDREEEIYKFRSNTYYEVSGEFIDKKSNQLYKGTWFKEGNTKIDKIELAEKIKSNTEHEDGIVSDIKKDVVKQPHPLLHNITSLQRTMNREYGYSSSETEDIMQKLYEELKIISYPRTDSRYIKQSMVDQLPEIISCLTFDKFEPYAKKCLNQKKLLISERLVNDDMVTDHAAVIPTINQNLNKIYPNLSEKEKNVFNEIALSFLSCFYSDYIYESIKIITEVKENTFLTHSIKVVDPGWKCVYDYGAGSNTIKEINPGDKVTAEKVLLEKLQTKPPERYTEDTLLKVMENPSRLLEEENLRKAMKGHGIGTSATRSKIINNLIDREYITIDKKHILPTNIGAELINAVTIKELKNVEFTAQIEENIEKIKNGELDKNIFMKQIIKFIKDGVEQIKSECVDMPIKTNIKNTQKYLGECPYCKKGKIFDNKKGWGCTRWKEGCRFYVARNIAGIDISEEQVIKLISNGKTDLIRNFKGPKGPFNAALEVDSRNKKIHFKRCSR